MAESVNPRAHACRNCVKAKAKCYNYTDGRCERCKRLSKECTTPEPVGKKRQLGGAMLEDHASQLAQIEQKVDGLVSLLSTSQHTSMAADWPVPTPESTTISSTGSEKINDPLHVQLPELYNSSIFQASSAPTTHEHFGSRSSATKNGPITDQNHLLRIFHENLAKQVPFITIPRRMTANELSKERPFLYQAVIMVASYDDSVHQMSLAQDLLKYLTNHLILRGEKNIDFLQGLMVHLTWYNKLFLGNTQMNTLLGLVFSLLVDLYLTAPPYQYECHEKFVGEFRGAITNYDQPSPWPEPMEERKRPILGAFYFFSCLYTNFSKSNPLQWNFYIQQCFEDVSKAPENDNDVYLIHLVGLQRIAQSVRHSGIQDCQSEPSTRNGNAGSHLSVLWSALKTFKTSLPEQLREDPLMLMHYHSVEIILFELGFYMPLTALVDKPTLQRVDVLSMCQSAIGAFLNIYLSIGLKPYISFSTVHLGQIYFAMTTLSKLSLFNAEDWSARSVRSALDFSAVADRVAAMMEDASLHYDRGDNNKPWFRISRLMRHAKVLYEKLVASEDLTIIPQPLSQTRDGVVAVTWPSSHFDLLNDEFWQTFPESDYMQSIS